jgi:hypothetical protein
MPPVSNVFHPQPQVQNHLSSLRGDQPQRGQRMRGGPDASGFFPSSSSRSGTMTGLFTAGLMPAIMTSSEPLWGQEEGNTNSHVES